MIVNRITYSAKKSELQKVNFWARSIILCEKTSEIKEGKKLHIYNFQKTHFDNLYKNWCYRNKNGLFWVLIFLLSHKINILWTPEKIFEAAQKSKLAVTILCQVKIIRHWRIIIWQIMQKLSPQPQKSTFLFLDFFAESQICHTTTIYQD